MVLAELMCGKRKHIIYVQYLVTHYPQEMTLNVHQSKHLK